MEIKVKIEGLDCPTCAYKMEKAIRKFPEVKDVSVSFVTQCIFINTVELSEEQIDALIQKTGDACHVIEDHCKLSGHKKIAEIDKEND